MKPRKIMIIFGTRPEAIKVAPVINVLRQYQDEFITSLVVTAQHRHMLDQVIDVFQIDPDYDLDIMKSNQSLTDTTVNALVGLEQVIINESPDLVLVQGDTTTAFVGGLAAFYHQVPVGHIEAGLRTWNKYNPYPEEINRRLIDAMADLCFAPTLSARNILMKEGIPESHILVTGNTVIDALFTVVKQERQFSAQILRDVNFNKPAKTLLVTAHRRESLGVPLESICYALRDLLMVRKELQVIFPVHLNPKVRETVWSILGSMDRAFLVDPLDYLDFVQLIKCVDLILTDSGGIQEEAPSLGKPVLVIRETTERPEAIEAGAARLVGTSQRNIVFAVQQLLDDQILYEQMEHTINPYGDGYAAQRIIDSIRHYFDPSASVPIPFQVDMQNA